MRGDARIFQVIVTVRGAWCGVARAIAVGVQYGVLRGLVAHCHVYIMVRYATGVP